MARGSPDWRQYAPYRIGAIAESDIVVVPGSSTGDILEVVGAGYLYSARISAMPGTSHETDSVYCIIDGNTMDSIQLRLMIERTRRYPLPGCFYMTHYDEENLDFSIALLGGVPFTSSVLLHWINNQAGGITLTSHITTSRL